MERDFLGLGSAKGSVTVKKESYDESKDSVMRNSGMQWPFSTKVSAAPQFLSFEVTQEDRSRKTFLDAVPSHGFMSISTADVIESSQKPLSGAVQKNAVITKHVGGQSAVTMYPAQRLDVHPVHSQEALTIPFSNQSNQTSHIVLSNSVLQSCLASNGHNVVNSIIKAQPLGNLPQAVPVSVLHSRGSIVGTTDLRSSSKSPGTPAQLTIFYGGSVCVYDDISPEKAQAIMLLAGNGSSPAQNKIVSTAQMQPSVPMPSKGDCFIISQPSSATLPNPLSISSSAGSQSVGVSFATNDPPKAKPMCSSATNVSHTDPSNIVRASTSKVPSVALPLARKASLARFLEKRKERVVNTSPYPLSKRPLECSTPGSEGSSLPANSVDSCPLPASN